MMRGARALVNGTCAVGAHMQRRLSVLALHVQFSLHCMACMQGLSSSSGVRGGEAVHAAAARSCSRFPAASSHRLLRWLPWRPISADDATLDKPVACHASHCLLTLHCFLLLHPQHGLDRRTCVLRSAALLPDCKTVNDPRFSSADGLAHMLFA